MRRNDILSEACLTLVKVSLLCHSYAGLCVRGNLWEAVKRNKTLMDGFRKHRSHATALASVGMTCFLNPASHIVGMTYLLRPALCGSGMTCFLKPVKVSLPCHSNVGLCVRGNLWEAVKRSKTLMDGLNSYRSHAFAHMPTLG